MEFSFHTFLMFLSIVAVPFHILLAIALYRTRKYFSRGFHSVTLHLTICHTLCSILKIIATIPTAFPDVRLFLNQHPTLDWIEGIISTTRSYSLKWIVQALLAVVALNRLAAVVAPLAFHKRNNQAVTFFCWFFWIFFLGIRIPIIWPLHLIVYHPIDAPQITIYTLEEQGFTTFYIWIGIIVGVSSLIITYISYMIIVSKVFIYHILGSDHMKPQVKRSVIVACTSTLGILVMTFVEAAEEVYWRLWEVDFVQSDTFYKLTYGGFEYSIWSLPITMIIMFPELRDEVLRFLRLKKTNVVQVIQLSPFSTPTRLTDPV